MEPFSPPSETENRGVRTTTLVWSMVTLVLFLLPVAFGYLMRLIQANLISDSQHLFYNYLTAHGLLMVGIWFTSALSILTFSVGRYVKPNLALYLCSLALVVIGALASLWSVFIGDMATGWYFLYPLPLRVGTEAGRTVFFASLGILGVGWFLGCTNLFLAFAQKYSLLEAFGWHYILRREGPEVPPMVMIAAVSMVAVIICILMAVLLLLLYLVELLTGVANDALLMKNLSFVFGHTVANMNLYLIIAVLYDYFPKFGGGEFKNNRMLAIVWNSVLGIVLFAYFHHLYMDFAQPTVVQYVGEFASYGAGVAAATFTIYSVLAFVSTHKMNWTFSSLLLFIAVCIWTVGGIGALIDATIPVNFKMHNTLWVPAHFHSYYFTGAVLMLFAFMWSMSCEVSGIEEPGWMKRILLPLIIIGGTGFVFMFYLGGMSSIPRRYATYPSELSIGTEYAQIAVAFIALFVVSYLILAYQISRRMIVGLRK